MWDFLIRDAFFGINDSEAGGGSSRVRIRHGGFLMWIVCIEDSKVSGGRQRQTFCRGREGRVA